MTVRSSNQALQNQKFRRGQTLAQLFRVTRNDGFVLTFTDHDRSITLNEETYTPAFLGGISAERREADLKSGGQEARGIVDGVTILIPDLLGNKYRGAKVEQTIVDWRRPWVWHYKATKRIRMMSYDGSAWVATMEGLTAQLQTPVGGRFGGMHSQQCTYTLGDTATCKADIADDFVYNETSFSVYGGVGSGTTAIIIVGNSVAWTTNQWQGHYLVLRSGAQRGKERLIISNTATALTLESAFDAAPANAVSGWIGRGPRVDTVIQPRMEFTVVAADWPTASSYPDNFYRDGEIEWMTGANAGTISPIIEHEAGTRRFLLLLPTPFDIAASDRGIIRPGCDGLIGTCSSKFRQFPFKEGTTTASSTTTIVNDTAAGMIANQFANAFYYLRMVTGPLAGEQRLITANATNSYTVSPAFSAAPAAGVSYRVVKSNVENFGGTDVYSPGANSTIRQVEQ